MMKKPNPVKYTIDEGGCWIPWAFAGPRREAGAVHCILFEDGMVFDVINGWRSGMNYCPHCGSRKSEDVVSHLRVDGAPDDLDMRPGASNLCRA